MFGGPVEPFRSRQYLSSFDLIKVIVFSLVTLSSCRAHPLDSAIQRHPYSTESSIMTMNLEHVISRLPAFDVTITVKRVLI